MKLTKARLKQLIKEELKLHIDTHVIFTPNPNYKGIPGTAKWLRKISGTATGDIPPEIPTSGDIVLRRDDPVLELPYWELQDELDEMPRNVM